MSKNSPHAIRGSAAFLDPDISTIPSVDCGPCIKRGIRKNLLNSVTNSSKRLDMDIISYLLAEIFYVGINRSVINVVFVSHNIAHNHLSFYRYISIFYEVFENGKFRFREWNEGIIFFDCEILGID